LNPPLAPRLAVRHSGPRRKARKLGCLGGENHGKIHSKWWMDIDLPWKKSLEKSWIFKDCSKKIPGFFEELGQSRIYGGCMKSLINEGMMIRHWILRCKSQCMDVYIYINVY